MLLIRGIKGEEYARKISDGIVGCRDLLSTILTPPKTGYNLSDYFDENLIRTIFPWVKKEKGDYNSPHNLYSVLTDCFLPHIYITYFHILNERTIDWLDLFEDDVCFIAVNINLDKITDTAIGNCYFGSKLEYVESFNEIDRGGYHPFNVACMCSMEHLYENKADLIFPLKLYNTIFFPLMYRECCNKFTDIENEFRIIAYDCPIIRTDYIRQKDREVTIFGDGGVEYRGVLRTGQNTIFRSNMKVMRELDIPLMEILEHEKGRIEIDSEFKEINIREVSTDYIYLGHKNECREYVFEMFKHPPQDVYVNRTKRVRGLLGDAEEVSFFRPSFIENI